MKIEAAKSPGRNEIHAGMLPEAVSLLTGGLEDIMMSVAKKQIL